MPYTATSANLPAHVKGLPEKVRARWAAIWNATYAACQKEGGKDCEGQAFRIANGVIREVDMEEARGQGMGVGSDRQQDGGADQCVCPNCKAQVKHDRGTPCVEVKCPKCGAAMRGATAQESHTLDELLLLCTEREVPEVYSDTIKDIIEVPSSFNNALINSVFAAIQEAAVMKTEDGVKYPAKAFAYVPDSTKPSTWKLRLWDKTMKVTRAMLGAAAAAFSPGGHRGQRVQIPSGEVAKVKGRIRAAYRALKVEPKNIPKSVREAEPMERLIAREASALSEADYNDDKGEVTVTVIRPGFNTSKKRFYPHETLARDYKVFEGLKMFADHQTAAEERARPERSIRSWVGSIKSVFVDEGGSIKARATIHAPWFKETLANLKASGSLTEMGTSIVAAGQGYKTEVEGHKTDFIERLVHGRSVDFVTYPGAGGMVECYESAQPEDEYDVDVVTEEGLRERRPDLIELIEAAVKEKLGKEVAGMTEIEKELKELKESNQTLTARNEELTMKVEATEAEEAKRTAQGEIATLIKDAELPDPTKARLTEQFKEAGSVDGVAEAIEAAKTELAALSEAGKIKDLGITTPAPAENGDAEKRLYESMKEHYIEQGCSNEEAERMATTYVKGR